MLSDDVTPSFPISGILKKGHQPGVYVPLGALFLVAAVLVLLIQIKHMNLSSNMSKGN